MSTLVHNTPIICVHFMVKQEQKGVTGTDVDLVSHKACSTVVRVSQCELLVESEWDTSTSQYHINPLLTVTCDQISRTHCGIKTIPEQTH